MPTTTTHTPMISDANLAARWQQFTTALNNPAAQDINGSLQQIAEDQQSNIAPLLGVFAQRLLDGGLSQPTTTTELLADFSEFITRGIADYEQRAMTFEQRYIDAFRTHAIMRLRPQSFRTGARVMTNVALDSTIELVGDLNTERIALENEIIALKHAFNDPDGRIILAHDRTHAIGNQLAAIMGYASGLQQENLDSNSQREYLMAIQTTIRNFAERNRPTLDDNPIELVRRMHPRAEVTMQGITPTFLNERHPMLVVKALGHLVDNAFKAGAKNIRIKAECQPSDPLLAIGIEDDGPGIPTDIRDQLVNGQGGSGWDILRRVTLRQLGAHYEIKSPFQSSEPYGTLVMLFIPVVAQTGDEPGTGRRARKADSGPLLAINSITPPKGVPVIERPASVATAFEPNVTGAAACFSDAPGATILQFRKL